MFVKAWSKILSNKHKLPLPPSPIYAATTKAWLESVRLCGELVVGTRVLYYGVPFWRDAITVNVGHKRGLNFRLHFLRISYNSNASGSRLVDEWRRQWRESTKSKVPRHGIE